MSHDRSAAIRWQVGVSRLGCQHDATRPDFEDSGDPPGGNGNYKTLL
jgi:hypothetical protein